MNVDRWHVGDEDPGREKRLLVGYAAGVAVVLLLIGVASTVEGAALPAAEEEKVVDVKLASRVESAPEPPPPPPPPPPPALEKAASLPPGPAPRKAIVAPTAIPTEAPPESSAVPPPQKDDEYGDGKRGVIGGAPGGTGTGTVPVAAAPPPPAPPPPPPPPPPPGPVALSEDMTPPAPVSTPQPAYPADARSEGIQATVVVKFVISESGEVTNVTIVRGHPLFDAAVLSTVRGWRYRPALADGKPVSVSKTVPIRFSIKT